MAERTDELEASAARARGVGAIHHRFGIGDGFVQVIDEWESGEQFEQFFGDPKMPPAACRPPRATVGTARPRDEPREPPL